MNTFAGKNFGEDLTVTHLRAEVKRWRKSVADLQGQLQLRDDLIAGLEHTIGELKLKIFSLRAALALGTPKETEDDGQG